MPSPTLLPFCRELVDTLESQVRLSFFRLVVCF